MRSVVQGCGEFVVRVKSLVASRVQVIGALLGNGETVPLTPGKMLRTRFGARLVEAGAVSGDSVSLERACAATELVHSASLCHDDVIDNGLLRRAAPTLWRVTSPSAAVLIGDMLLCESTGMLLETDGGRYLAPFLAKVREVCAAETRQELLYRGRELDDQTHLHLARGKTGPLFAFVGYVFGGRDEAFRSALEEAGYRVGTAYQLGDDLVDVAGDEGAARKTLGTDRVRRKFTLAQSSSGDGARAVRERVRELCAGAVQCVGAWPEARAGLCRFLDLDLKPALERCGARLDASMGHVA